MAVLKNNFPKNDSLFDNEEYNTILNHYLRENYDRIWLKSMILKGRHTEDSCATLITGSSYALNGIMESCWKNATNCSMHSQDLYYDYLCAREIIDKGGRFQNCFIIMGYYTAFQDLSLSKISRETVLREVYIPVLHDSRHWDIKPIHDKKTDGIEEQISIDFLLHQGTYYSDFKRRGTLYNFEGIKWFDLPEERRIFYARKRVKDHMRLLSHKKSFAENCRLLRDYTGYLVKKEIHPVIVIPPLTEEYNSFVDSEMKRGMQEMLKYASPAADFYDFNVYTTFSKDFFMDTDHLNPSGAYRMSKQLVNSFGR